ncbi:hypothetical protein PAXINDRAFT_124692 [Paxillus involutus ATCC 200175]|nr:hypothetical protein PAXINDRAFT_124692 [Paxillus involutus ATCC 200175]
MQRRGRSRQVSPVAVARLASEERRQSQREQDTFYSEPQVPPNPDDFLSPVPPPTNLSPHLEKLDLNSLMNVRHDTSFSSLVGTSQSIAFSTSILDSHCTSPSSPIAGASPDSSTTASLSADSIDSLPSPPRSLEDQVQVAYALDDIRLAKILLLKLKGIEVSSDTDPRIDEVRDEDFDMYFVPSGPLTLEDADKRALQETQRKQREWWEESQRVQRLKACEKIWEEEKQRLHAERLRAIQIREEEVALEDERRRLAEKQLREQAERELQKRDTRARVERYSSTKRGEDPFQYSFMPPTKASGSTLPRRLGSTKVIKKVPTRSPGSRTQPVSFREVINSMNGKLFPLDAFERAEEARRIAGLTIMSSPTRHRSKVSVRAELLDSLLQVVEWQEGERRRAKGKDVERNPQVLKSPVHAPTPMPSIPSSESDISMSSASTSRSSSWLSFSSWRSSGTEITTPDSSVSASPSWRSSGTEITTPDSSVSASPRCSVPGLLPTVIDTQRDLQPRYSFTAISLEESPLCPPRISYCYPVTHKEADRDDAPSTPDTAVLLSNTMRMALVKRVTLSVATVVEAARGLQLAYISATMFAAGASQPHHATAPQPRDTSRCQRQARCEGYRALAEDVKKFTASTTPITLASRPIHFIPLVSPFPVGAVDASKSRPAPGNVVVFPSPLRPRTPPAVLAYRMRPVANPAVLRLRALQNLMCARGKVWEGRAREGGLGCGKERMLGVAFEGRGRSGLGCEVRFVVA